MAGSISWYNGTGLIANAVGTTGQVLTSQGASAPIWATPSGASAVKLISYLSTTHTNVTGDGTVYTIPYNAVTLDTASGLNTSTGAYTIPTTGAYFIQAQVHSYNTTANNTEGTMAIYVNGNPIYLKSLNPWNISFQTPTDDVSIDIASLVSLTSADVVTIRYTVTGDGSPTNNVFGQSPGFVTWFNLFQVA